jgi:hypothetical protein
VAEREVYLLAERLSRLEKAQLDTNARLAETNAKLGDVLETLKQMANIQLALRIGQEQLTERVVFLADRLDHVADRVDRVADRVDRLSAAVIRGFTQRDEQVLELRERVDRLERRLGPEEPSR